MRRVRRFTESGERDFVGWIADGGPDPVPLQLLEGVDSSEQLDFEVEVDETIPVASLADLGKHLNERFVADRHVLWRDTRMWSWLALLYIGRLRKKGNALFAKEHYVIFEADPIARRKQYRQFTRISWHMYQLHGEKCQAVFASQRSLWGEMAEQILGREDFARNPGLVSAIGELYIDESGGVVKGAAGKRPKKARRDPTIQQGLGSIRRLGKLMAQIEKTYDTWSMGAKDLLPLLPREFDRWKQIRAVQSADGTTATQGASAGGDAA